MAQAERVDLHAGLVHRLESRKAKVCIVGLGYVGLPLALAAAEAGHDVTGIDLLVDRVDRINNGGSYVEDIRSDDVSKMVKAERLRATTLMDSVPDADVVVIAVPTPLDEGRIPDLSYVKAAAEGIAAVVSEGTLVVLESTTYPGTTEEIIVAAIESRGLTVGVDIFVGYSPERIDPGNKTWSLRNTPKVVAGYTDKCRQTAIAFYSAFVEEMVPVSDLRTAEMTKLFENTFRLVNIGLVNEFQSICESLDLDVWQVLEACASKPYGFMSFSPGPGVGGHCIPVDPSYLAWKVRERGGGAEFIELANRINDAMPERLLNRITAKLKVDRHGLTAMRIGLLGVAYKKNSSDLRESPALGLLKLLRNAGSVVSYHDPLIPVVRLARAEIISQDLTPAYLEAQHCIVIVADHDSVDWSLVAKHASTIIDTRNVIGRLDCVDPQTARPRRG